MAGINRRQNVTAMLGIIAVACMILAVLCVQGYSLQKKIHVNNSRLTAVEQQIEEEKARTEEITDMKNEMESDEFIERMAKEKLGMVKENEILFKEAQ